MQPREVALEKAPTAKRLPLDKTDHIGAIDDSVHPGCVWPVAFLLALVATMEIVGDREPDGSTVVLLIGLTVSILGLCYLAVWRTNIWNAERKKASETRTRIQERNRDSLHQASREAENLTATLRHNYESSKALASQLPVQLEVAARWLERAEREFRETAFSPFWDAVENSARELAAFKAMAEELSHNAARYHTQLAGRNHTFPPFPVQPDDIPDVSAVLRRFHAVVRMAQTNFQFSNIWEHRRTRGVLIAGFRTLGEAIGSLGATIEGSLAELQASLTPGTTLNRR